MVRLSLALVATSTLLAQTHRLQPVTQGELLANTPQMFSLRAGAGELISGTFEQQPPANVTMGLYARDGSKLREVQFYGDPGPRIFGFVAPAGGDYEIRLTGESQGSFTLRTERRTPAERMKGAAIVKPVPRFHSPRIGQLEKETKARVPGVVEHFWSETKTRGGPIIEPIDGDDQRVLVTFLWAANYETHNVHVNWPSPDPQNDYMTHLAGTNVWFLTLRIFRGSVFWYAIAPNYRSDDPQGISLTSQNDPLNTGQEYDSLLITPGAPDSSWWRNPPAARGEVTQQHLDSEVLRTRRDISVYTPPGYSSSNGPYALLVLFDGNNYLRGMDATVILDNLVEQNRIRRTVVCFVSDNRTLKSIGTADQRQAYATAMATELVPWLRSSYAISSDPGDVVVAGYSDGARSAGTVALAYPSVFGNVLLQSGGAGLFLPMILDRPKLPVRFYIDFGLYEYGPWLGFAADERPFMENPLVLNRHFRDVLIAKGYDVTYRESGTTHEAAHWRATLAQGLMALLGETAKE